MKFERTIKAGADLVWAVFDNPDNLPRWQPTLKSFTPRYGEPGQPGAVSDLEYDEKGRKVVIIETVTEKRKPHFLAGTYEGRWSKSLVVNHFEAVDDGSTRFTCYSSLKFKGLMKLLSPFFAKSIRQRIEDDLGRFKLLVESVAVGNRR